MSKKIFLLRGLIRETAHWGNFLDIVKTIPDYDIETMQIPGTGELYNDISPNQMEQIVESMRSQFLEKKGDENIIVAISLGGMISTCWLKKYPNDFKKAILINSSLKGISPLLHRLKPKSVLTVAKCFLTDDLKKRERLILNMVSNNHINDENILGDWVKIQKERPVHKQSAINQIKAALTFTPPINKPNIPIKIITSKADRMVSYKCSQNIAKRWNAPIAIHQTAGHDIPIDEPVWLKDEIKAFL